jgi:hypothetical protein
VFVYFQFVFQFVVIINKDTTFIAPLEKLQKFVPWWYMIIIAALFIFVIDLCMLKASALLKHESEFILMLD